jgi:hypothetical protein
MGKKYKRGMPLLVDWMDANTPLDSVGWTSMDDVKKQDPKFHVQSIGFVAGIKGGYLKLVGEQSVAKQYAKVTSRTINIPIACIISAYSLTVKEGK